MTRAAATFGVYSASIAAIGLGCGDRTRGWYETRHFRILLGPGGRNRGLGSEATRLTIDHAFSTTELHRLELEVFAFNPRAQRVCEKAGFVVEGVRRDALRFDGAFVDAVVMSILRPEWESRRRAIAG